MFDTHLLEAERLMACGFDRLKFALQTGDVHNPRLARLIRRRERQVMRLCEKIRKT